MIALRMALLTNTVNRDVHTIITHTYPEETLIVRTNVLIKAIHLLTAAKLAPTN